MNCLTVLKQSLSVLLKCPVETKTIRKDGIDMDLPTANGKKFIDAITAFRQTIKQIEQAKPVSDAEKAILDLRQAIEQAEKMEPFGIWHQGATEEESDFFLFKDAGDVSCHDCIKLYTNPPTATLTSEMLIEAALSASAARLLSGTTNWAKHVQRKLLVKQPTTPAVGNTTCNPHPDAPHGFNHSASHAGGRYVCKCEGWMPPTVSKDN